MLLRLHIFPNYPPVVVYYDVDLAYSGQLQVPVPTVRLSHWILLSLAMWRRQSMSPGLGVLGCLEVWNDCG